MKRIGRDAFLKGTAGTAIALANFLYPDIIHAARLTRSTRHPIVPATQAPSNVIVHQMTGPDPSFAGGEVVTKTGDGVVVQSHAAIRPIRIASDALVWKEFAVTADAIQVGDWLDVKGTPLSDGSLLAQWIFVNIGRRDGVVGQIISPTSLLVQQGEGSYTMELSSRLDIIHAEDGSALPGGLASLLPGTRFGAVGIRLPNNRFRATKIWTWNT